jgi:hypothetical protein
VFTLFGGKILAEERQWQNGIWRDAKTERP